MLVKLNIIDLISDFHSNPNIVHMRKLNFTLLSYNCPIRASTNCSIFFFFFLLEVFNSKHKDPENAFTIFPLSHSTIDLNLSELLNPS